MSVPTIFLRVLKVLMERCCGNFASVAEFSAAWRGASLCRFGLDLIVTTLAVEVKTNA